MEQILFYLVESVYDEPIFWILETWFGYYLALGYKPTESNLRWNSNKLLFTLY